VNDAEDDPMRVSLLITCVVDVVAPEVGEAVVHTLRAAGCTVSCDLAQTCCGRPAWDAGFAEDAASVARPTLAALEAELERGAAAVVVPSGSCAAMVQRHWPEMFAIAGDVEAARRAGRVGERTLEWSALLAGRADHLPELALHRPRRLVLHRTCHLRDPGDDPAVADPGDREPAAVGLLDRVGGGELEAWTGSDRCCGFGGAAAVAPPDELPELAGMGDLDALDALDDPGGAPGADGPVALTDEKLRALLGVDVVVGCDTACLLHLRARAEALGTPIEIRHLAQVIEDALPAPVAEVRP
jgi:L-lactate dehydrogenase complex protein LldE